MSQTIMIGCDLHDRTMLLRFAVDAGMPQERCFPNDARGRRRLMGYFKRLAEQTGAESIVMVYEASGQGFGLADLLHQNGIECFVLSPTHLPKTPKAAKLKTDSRDAQMLLEQLRAHILAGNALPAVWTPPQRLRDDRELVRARVDTGDEITRVKLQILSTLKRRDIRRQSNERTRWSKKFLAWLRAQAASMDPVVGVILENLVCRYESLQQEILRLERALRKLAKTDRYQDGHAELRKIKGVGLLSAMTFLTEMGDLTRFHNRREVAAYLGLCPSSFETGQTDDRKGRITRQGPARLRKILCQSAWVGVIHCPETANQYNRIKGGKSNRNKKALVAVMRKLAIKMWHRALSAGVHKDLFGRGGPHEQFNCPQTM